MKSLTQLTGIVSRNFKAHSPVIFSVAAGVGTLFTAYLAGRASFEAANVIRNKEDVDGTNPDKKERLKERTKLVWKLYIPSAISTTSTILFILGANRTSARKLLASQAAINIAQQTFNDYREQVIKEYGTRKDQSLRDKAAAERVNKNPPPENMVMLSGPGMVLFCELHTGRYFLSDIEKVRKAVNEINSHILKHDYATLDDWYHIIGLDQTTTSGNFGWRSNRLLELSFSTMMTKDEKPCITFEYNYTMML